MSEQKFKTTARSLSFIFSADYDMDLGAHVFPAVKYGFVYTRLVEDDRFRRCRFLEPEALQLRQARRVHTAGYVADLARLEMSGRLSRSEIPLNADIVRAFCLSSGGTLLAARKALEHGIGLNIGGGFHHCFADHAEGFCYLNDVAIAIRTLQAENKIRRALVVDLDVHQGNGTANIFENDETVFTFSMHEENNYPLKEKGDYDIGLDRGVRDEEYLTLLSQAMASILRRFKPDIVFYLAGVDCYEKDRHGGLRITRNGMAERDRMVRDFCTDLPLAVVLAGGYAFDTEDTVQLHVQTAEVFAGLI